MEPEVRIPREVREACRLRDIELEQPIASAQADMSPEGELRRTYWILLEDRLVFAVSAHSGEMLFSRSAGGFGKAASLPPGGDCRGAYIPAVPPRAAAD